MTLTLVTILAYTVGLPAVVGLWFYKKLSGPLKTITVLFTVGTITEAVATLFRHLFNNNMIVYNTYVVFEAFLVLLFLVQCSSRTKNVYKLLQLLVIVLFTVETLMNPNAYNSLTAGMESIAVIGGIIFLFYRIAFGQDIDRYVFYTSGVLLFYFVSNAIYFSLMKYLEMKALIFVAEVHVCINVFCNFAYAVILWKASHSKLLLSE